MKILANYSFIGGSFRGLRPHAEKGAFISRGLDFRVGGQN